ncbi:hypothetical protein PFICI_00718 [Pestalotiopsis fici W106-1]|uniref:Acetylornithine aminotransferase n=1 Tax=Pestalotiopsis fici (strain W106-1 / CGMCC3.15140) TaxID=1229662 RepID=W3XLN6_PESFW|nr:uncharacterized protein PFICI_00718 [Pestalotiopsis fici W106-1]ETS86890.1 hypothetical protein PFICI_00718 [Pestalotiopsis fici W106-1]
MSSKITIISDLDQLKVDLHADKHPSKTIIENNALSESVWRVDNDQSSAEITSKDGSVKYLVRGELVVKDQVSSSSQTAKAPCVILIPKGSQVSTTQSEDCKIIHINSSAADQLLSRYGDYEKRLEELIDRFIAANPTSEANAKRATSALPGGNTRTVLHSSPFPLIIKSGQGCSVTSAEGVDYVDLISEYSACMFGHSHPAILDAIQRAASIGINLSGVTEYEVQFAELVKKRFPSMELMRFCNSGTEANTMALAAALHYTKKRKVLVFLGGYHGGTLAFAKEHDPVRLPHEFVIGTYNDVEGTRKLMDSSIGAILVEPMKSAGGMIPGTREFLSYLREAATACGAVLIFDEVVTSRLHYHGLQGYHDITPDMTTLGKYIGGGFAFGAFGGRQEIMATFDPASPSAISHSGTYNNNIFTMIAGIAGCHILGTEEISRTNELGDLLRDGINEAVTSRGSKAIWATGHGSAIGLHFESEIVKDCFYFELLERKIMIGRRGFTSLNIMHKKEHMEQVLEVIVSLLDRYDTYSTSK